MLSHEYIDVKRCHHILVHVPTQCPRSHFDHRCFAGAFTVAMAADNGDEVDAVTSDPYLHPLPAADEALPEPADGHEPDPTDATREGYLGNM